MQNLKNPLVVNSKQNEDRFDEKIFSLQEVLRDSREEPDPVIGNGILLNQTLLLISGKKKTLKTMLTMNLALGLANGKTFSLFEIHKKHRVLLLSAEGGYFPNRRRIKKMSKRFSSKDEIKLDLSFDSRLRIDLRDGQNRLREILKHFKPEVLILDPLIKFHNCEENSSKEMNVVMTQLRNLIEDFNISIILVHHMGKSETSGPRGSSAIQGEYDSSIEMSWKDRSNKELKMEFDLRHSESPDPKTVVFNPDTFWFENKTGKPSIVELVVSDQGPISRKDLAERLVANGTYKNITGAYKPIKILEKKKTIILNSDGLLICAK